MRSPKSTRNGLGPLTNALLLLLVAGGCRLDMHDAPRFDALEESPLFADGASARPLVEGTVARGEHHPDKEAFYAGWDAEQNFLEGLPPGLELSRALLERGRERFEIFCTPCHGFTGAGDGMIVQRGFRPPPTFHNARNREEGLGRIFFVITYGYGQMYSYGHAIKPRDRWAIAAYIRTLQLSQNAPLSAVPEKVRVQLEEMPRE